MLVLVTACGRDFTVTLEREDDLLAATAALDLPFLPANLDGSLLSVKSKFSESGWVVVPSLSEAMALLEGDPDASGPPRILLELPAGAAAPAFSAAPAAAAPAPAAAAQAPRAASAAGPRAVRHIGHFGRDLQLVVSALGVTCSAVSVALILYHFDGGVQPLLSMNDSLKAAFAGAVLLLLAGAVFLAAQLRSWGAAGRFQLSVEWLPTVAGAYALLWLVGAVLTVVGLSADWNITPNYYGDIGSPTDRSSMIVGLILSCAATLFAAINSYQLFAAMPPEEVEVVVPVSSLNPPEGARRVFVALLVLVGACLLTADDALDVDIVLIAFITAMALVFVLLSALFFNWYQPAARETGALVATTLGIATLSLMGGLEAWLSVSINIGGFEASNSSSTPVNAGTAMCLAGAVLAVAEELFHLFARLSPAPRSSVVADPEIAYMTRQAKNKLVPGFLILALAVGGLAAFMQQSEYLAYRITWNGEGGGRPLDYLFVFAAAIIIPFIAVSMVIPDLLLNKAFKFGFGFLALLNLVLGIVEFASPPFLSGADDSSYFVDAYGWLLWGSSAYLHVGAVMVAASGFGSLLSVALVKSPGLEVDLKGCKSAAQGAALIATLGLSIVAVAFLANEGAVPIRVDGYWSDTNATLYYGASKTAIVLALVVTACLSVVSACATPLLGKLSSQQARFVIALRLALAVGLLAFGTACLIAYSDLHATVRGQSMLPSNKLLSDYLSGRVAALCCAMAAGVTELAGVYLAASVSSPSPDAEGASLV